MSTKCAFWILNLSKYWVTKILTWQTLLCKKRYNASFSKHCTTSPEKKLISHTTKSTSMLNQRISTQTYSIKGHFVLPRMYFHPCVLTHIMRSYCYPYLNIFGVRLQPIAGTSQDRNKISFSRCFEAMTVFTPKQLRCRGQSLNKSHVHVLWRQMPNQHLIW